MNRRAARTEWIAVLIGIVLLPGAPFLSGCTSVIRSLPVLSDEDENSVAHLYSTENPQFLRTLGSLLGPAIVPGNKITTLLNGKEIFPAMLDAIKSAEHSVTLETYIYWDGKIGEEFKHALIERAKAGVKVHTIIDWVGLGRLNEGLVDDLRAGGVEVMLYNPLPWYNPLLWWRVIRLDNRTHRKLLVVDGKIGFTGGVGIADQWDGDAKTPEEWRDTHFRVEGPVVLELQSAFVDNWLEGGGHLLHGDHYFPPPATKGEALAQAFKSAPSEATANIELMYQIALASARKSIRISSSYFVPNEGTIAILLKAAKRGVAVEIILPGPHGDQPIVGAASRAQWEDLLEGGIRIYEYQPTMYHCKVLIVDDYFVSVGSTNFDDRSFRINDEANLNVFDREVAADQIRVFEDDKKASKEVKLEAWDDRGVHKKAGEAASLLLRPEL